MQELPPHVDPASLPSNPGARRTALLLLQAQARMNALVAEEGAGALGVGRSLTGVLLVLLGVLGLVGSAGALNGWIDRELPSVRYDAQSSSRTKFRYLETATEPFDVLFVGSSRVRRQIDPRRFDAELLAAGIDARSYNLGLSAMRHAETRSIVRRLLQGEDRPRLLVVELTGGLTHVFGRLLHEENPGSARAVAWHEPRSTALVLRAAAASDMSSAEKQAALAAHLEHLGRAWFSVGRGVPLAARLLGHDDQEPADRGRGYTPLDARAEKNARLQKSHAEMLANPLLLASKLARRDDLRWPDEPDPILLESFRELVDEAEAAGVRVLFMLLPPHWTIEDNEAFAGERRFGLPPILDYRDPARYPEFYSPEYLFNFNHLNARGAELLTRKLAADVARLWDG